MAKAPQAKAHRERAQPSHRSRLGLLEKHADYVKRARDFHAKEDRLKAMKVKAQYKNPNEFAFGMIRGKMGKDGTHRADPKERSLPTDVVRLLKSQDIRYVKMMKKVNEGHLKRILGDAHIDGSESDEPVEKGKHFKFIDSSDDEDQVLASVEQQPKEEGGTKETVIKTERVLTSVEQAEVKIRMERLKKLRLAERQLEVQRATMGPGRRTKVGVDEDGIAVYKWQEKRKK